MRYHCAPAVDSRAALSADRFQVIDAPDVQTAALACLRKANRTLIQLLDDGLPVYIHVAEAQHIRGNGIPWKTVTVEFRKAESDVGAELPSCVMA